MLNVKIGKGLAIDVNVNNLPAAVMDHVVYIGLRNILMDSHASIKTDMEDYKAKAMAVVHKKLDAMYDGILRVAGERASHERVEGEARRLCLMVLRAKFKKQGTKLNSITTNQWAKMIDARWEAYIDQAEKNLAELEAMPMDEDDIELPVDDE
jgi:hypothetical protein